MNEPSEKYEDILQYELDALKEIRQKWFERAGERLVIRSFTKGTILGLALGILGSLFIQSLYPEIQVLQLGEYNPTSLGNLAVCGISLILMVFVSAIILRQLAVDADKLELSKKTVEVIEYAIKRLQHSLEQKTKEQKSSV